MVRHLLSHVSGLSTFSGRQHFGRPDNSPQALANYVQELKDVRPTASVGSTFQYSNANFTLLARVVEVVSGVQFEQYVQERILMPLGMERTCILPQEPRDRAIGHRYWFGWPVAHSGVPTSRIHLGATGIHSSAEELSRFLIAQLNGGRFDGHEVLSPAGVAMPQRPAVEIRPSIHYALGWDTRDTPNGLYVGHRGDSAGFHTDLVMSPADRWGVVVLMNANGGDGAGEMVQLARDVLDLSRGKSVSPPRAAPFLLRYKCIILLALLVVQVLLAALFYRRVQRWRKVAEECPMHWWRLWAWHGTPLTLL